MAAKKFTVSHYLNTKAKPKDGNRYPIYLRVTYNRKSNSMASFLLNNEYLTEEEFNASKYKKSNSIPYGQEKTDLEKTAKKYFILMKREHDLLQQIFNHFASYDKKFSIYYLEHYVNIFQTKVEYIVKHQLSYHIKLELCEWLKQTLNLKYSIAEEIINDNIYSNRVAIITELLKVNPKEKTLLVLHSFCDFMVSAALNHNHYIQDDLNPYDFITLKITYYAMSESPDKIIESWNKEHDVRNTNEDYGLSEDTSLFNAAFSYLRFIIRNYLNQKIDELNKIITF